MNRLQKYEMMTRIAQENPHEFYSRLVAEYKKYDANQKQIIQDLLEDNRKLRIKVGQLESYVDEFISDDSTVVPKSTIKAYKDEIQHLRQACISTEKRLIESLYPQYATTASGGLISKIHQVISDYISNNNDNESKSKSETL